MTDIKQHMEIISLCGCLVGTVDHVEDGTIKLTRSPDGQPHFIPTEWVASVDECVHLNKDVFEAKYGWKSDATEVAGPSIMV
jgi:hypothetical protein